MAGMAKRLAGILLLEVVQFLDIHDPDAGDLQNLTFFV